jgi:hypothetical protein
MPSSYAVRDTGTAGLVQDPLGRSPLNPGSVGATPKHELGAGPWLSTSRWAWS